MEPFHEARYWALATITSDEFVPGSDSLRDSLVDWVQEHPKVLQADAAAFLLTNAINMYLIPVQGSPFLAIASQEPYASYLSRIEGQQSGDEAFNRVERNEELISRLQDDLSLLLDAALEWFTTAGEPISAHRMLQIVDNNWPRLRAWFF